MWYVTDGETGTVIDYIFHLTHSAKNDMFQMAFDNMEQTKFLYPIEWTASPLEVESILSQEKIFIQGS